MARTSIELDSKTFAIGVLSVTACILFVGFLLLSSATPSAYAIGMSDRSGDYIMLTQQLSTSQEGVVVVDAAAERLVLYAFDYNRGQMRVISRIPLDRLRKPREEGQQP